MNPRMRVIICGVIGAIVACIAGVGIANESYALAALVSLAALWTFVQWTHGAFPDAWLLAVALFGYIVGNRGFAQLQPIGSLPIFPAEAVLMAALPALILRLAQKRTRALWRDPLNIAVVLWVALGTARLPLDISRHGFLALRDSATIYYALFFFIAQSFAQHAASSRLLRQAMLAACTVLPFSYALTVIFPDFFLRQLVFRGTPLVYYKDDLVAAAFIAAFFLLLTVRAWPAHLRIVIAAAAFGSTFLINSSRAALMGLLVTLLWWAVARRWTPWKFVAIAVPFAALSLTSLALIKNEDFKQSRAYSLYEHVASMVDFTGTGSYSSEDRFYVGDNNRFRLAWWRAVANETFEENPVFGLGFGADITDRFVRTYELDLGDEFSTRSPHSIIFSIIGRMGLLGLALWIGVIGAMAARTLRLARQVRTDDSALPTLGWWSVSWVILTSACFGVVLEGPMGAIIFWTALGLANAADKETPATPTAIESPPINAAATA
jgi:O-antigen ligase